MAYSYLTFSAAEDLLAGILADLQGSISKTRWPSTELQLHILEALRTFSALTGIHEAESDPFAVSAGTQFIDLVASLGALRSQTLTVRDVIGPIQYALFEPYDPIDGTGMTEMFQFAEIERAIQRRRDRFLLETGCHVTRTVLPASPDLISAGQRAYALPETSIDVRRVAWVDLVRSRTSAIWPTSHWSMRSSPPRITLEDGTPTTYLVSEHQPLEIELNPIPASIGRLDLLTVNAGADLDADAPTLLGIPDDYAWVIKWGALADLLSKDGPARDYARSLFCERRYRMGVAAAVSTGILIGATINGRPAQYSTIERLDTGRPFWQSRSGSAAVVAPAGLNLLAIADPPSADISMTVEVKRNAIVPAEAGDYLQIGREYLDLVLGYAAHVAMFKVGGQEFAATTHLADSFFKACADYSDDFKVAYDKLTVDTPDEVKKAQGVRRFTGETVGQ